MEASSALRWVSHQARIALLFVATILCTLSTVQAATYYIDYNAPNDSANGTSKETPWKRCPGMVGFSGNYTHSPGDIFLFKGGVTWPYVSGSAILTIGYSGGGAGSEDQYTSDKTWYVGETWDYPIFDGGNQSTNIIGIYSKEHSNIILAYIKFTNIRNIATAGGQAITIIGGSNIHLRHNYISPNSVNCLSYSANGAYSGLYIHHNTFRQCGRVDIQASSNSLDGVELYNNEMEGAWDYDSLAYHTDGFMIAGDGIDDFAIRNLKIFNNKFWGDWQKGATAMIYLSGSNGIRFDYMNGSYQPSIRSGSGVYGEKSGAAGYVAKLTNTGGWSGSGTGTFWIDRYGAWQNGERIYTQPNGTGTFIGTVTGTPTPVAFKSTQNTLIYNNLFVPSHRSGTSATNQGIIAKLGHDKLFIYNNTFDFSTITAGAKAAITYMPAASIGGTSFITNVSVKNNIIINTPDGGIFFGDVGGDHVIDHNIIKNLMGNRLIWDASASARYDTCAHAQAAGWQTTFCSVADPLFIRNPTPAEHGDAGYGINNGDWHLQSGSPAKGAGADLSLFFAKDFAGNLRPQGSAWELGACGLTDITSAIATPANLRIMGQ